MSARSRFSMRYVCGMVLVLALLSLSMAALAEEATPLSLGKPYTFDVRNPLRNYPDPEAKKLTDGALSPTTSYQNPAWVGFWSTEPFALTIDLGEEMAIKQVRSHHLAGTAGITWPTRIFVQVSSNRVTWSNPIEMVTPEPIFPDEATEQWFTFDNLDLSGRYVQIVYFPPVEGKNIFIDEIEVY